MYQDDKLILKRTIGLGKVDGYGNGQKSCAVEIEIEVRHVTGHPHDSVTHEPLEEYDALSISGSVWNHQRTDILSGGQNYEELAALFPFSKRVRRIIEIWREWHLNDLTAGCAHQSETWTCTNLRSDHEAYLTSLAAVLAEQRTRTATKETCEAIADTEREIACARAAADAAHDAPIENGWIAIHTLFGEYPYPHDGSTCHVCGRNRWDEPSDACPESGYRYGTAWLVRPLPVEIVDELRSI